MVSFRRAEEQSNSTGPIVAPGYTRTDAPVLEPTVTIGGAPAGYQPATTLQPTVTIGGAPASYAETVTPNYITGAGVSGSPVYTPPTTPNYITGAGVPSVDTAVKPGGGVPLSDTPNKTLAFDTFKNTLAIFFGKDEVEKPWVSSLYSVTAKYYNTGSTIDESINLSVQDARNNPELKTFADRFSGIYALQDKLAKGEAVQVPTVADYFRSESSMGEVLRQAGMGELATQQFLGGVLGLGKSVLTVTNLINDTFKSIDNAPEALKKDLATYFPGVSRTDIAKALLMGKEGTVELNKKIAGISTLSAAKSQGVNIDLTTGMDLAAAGATYGSSLGGFQKVKQLERGQDLGRMSGIDFTQQEAIGSTFMSSAAADEKIRRINEEEANRFAAKSGRLASQNRASNQY